MSTQFSRQKIIFQAIQFNQTVLLKEFSLL